MSRDFLENAHAAADPDGRLPLGAMADWEVFPFEAESLRARPLTEYAVPEPDRRRPPEECKVCRAVEGGALGTWGRFVLVRTARTTLAFNATVATSDHLGLDDLPPEDHADLGRALGASYAAIKALPEVGNVHLNKWENGAGHLAFNLYARPIGVLQLRGSNLPIWADMLPAIAEDEFAARAEQVRQALG